MDGFWDRLERYRKSIGLSQGEFEVQVGLRKGYLTQSKGKGQIMGGSHLAKLVQAFSDIDIKYLLTGIKEPKSNILNEHIQPYIHSCYNLSQVLGVHPQDISSRKLRVDSDIMEPDIDQGSEVILDKFDLSSYVVNDFIGVGLCIYRSEGGILKVGFGWCAGKNEVNDTDLSIHFWFPRARHMPFSIPWSQVEAMYVGKKIIADIIV